MIEDYKNYLKKREVNNIINGVLSKFPLLGVTISKLGFKPDEFCKTACTDGKTVFWDENFLENLTYNEKVFLFAHEIMHVAFKHIFRRSKEMDKERWNIATDAVINARLKDEGLPIIEGGVDIPEALDKSAEEMYKILEEKEKEQSQNSDKTPNGEGGAGESSDGNNGNNSGHDNHDIWDEVIKKLEESLENSENNKSSNDVNGEGSSSQAIKESSTDASDMSENEEEDLSEIEKDFAKANKELKERKAKEIISNLKKKAGKGAGRQEVNLGSIETAKEVVKWKTILRREIDNEEFRYTYRRSDEDNDFQARGEMLDVYDHPMTECLLDTSGSVNENTLRNFLRQLKPLLRESKLKVGCFDNEFYGFTEIKRDQDIKTFRVVGRGGTSFDLALRCFSKDSDGVINKIIFTDGYDDVTENDFNKKLKNVYWLVYGSKTFKPCVGKVIFIDEKSLKFLGGASLEELSKE